MTITYQPVDSGEDRIDFYAPFTNQAVTRGIDYGIKTTSQGWHIIDSSTGSVEFGGTTYATPVARSLALTTPTQFYRVQIPGSGTAYLSATEASVATTGSQTIPYNTNYVFKGVEGGLYEFKVSSGTLYLNNQPQNSTVMREMGNLGVIVRVASPSGSAGSCTLTITRAATAESISPLSELHNPIWNGTGVTLNISSPTLTSDYLLCLQTAVNRINSQTDFTVTLSNTSGWPVTAVSVPNVTWRARVHQTRVVDPPGCIWDIVVDAYMDLNTYNYTYNEDRLKSIFTHELGHFAGLRDLKNDDYGPAMGVEYYHWLMYGTNSTWTEPNFNSYEIAAINEKANSNNLLSEITVNTLQEDTGPLVAYVDVTYIDEDLESAVSHTTHAVTGTVTAIGPAQSDGDTVYRLATVAVNDDLLGNAPSTVQVQLWGGNYEGVEYIYSGAASDWNVGDQVAVLLREQAPNTPGVREFAIPGGNYAFAIDNSTPVAAMASQQMVQGLKTMLVQHASGTVMTE